MSVTSDAAPDRTVSVIICAYTENRWADLQSAVASVLAQSCRPDEVLLVIDHNPALLVRARREFGGVGPGAVRVLANTHRQGLSGARNTAIGAAGGDILAFLDDDAVAAPTWLASLLAHYEDPRVQGVGGPAEPSWPDGRGRPLTLPAGPSGTGELDWVVGCSYTGLPESTGPLRNLMGCNMSVRATAFEAVGGFSEDLGRVGRTPLGDEETELCIRVRQRVPGAEFIFEPGARVTHRMTPDRMTWRYLLHRGYAEGLSKAAISRMVGQDDALSSERSYVASVLPRAILREVRRLDRRGAHGAVAVITTGAITAAGYLRGRLATAAGPRPVAPTVVDTRPSVPA